MTNGPAPNPATPIASPRPVAPALVTLWSKPNSSAQPDFVCSGVFVAPACVLTAAHAVGDAAPVWVSAFGSANSAPPMRVARHPDLDVALLFLESVPPFATALPCDRQRQLDRLPRPLTLNGSFEGRLEAPQVVSVLNFSVDDHQYLIEPKQPRGQSGSPVCTADGAIWAIAVRHYADANTARGGVIAVHQFADWLVQQLGAEVALSDVADVADASDASADRARSDPGVVAATPAAEGERTTAEGEADHDAVTGAMVSRRTEAALVSVGLDDTLPLLVSACVVSADPQRLRRELDELRQRTSNDPLAPPDARRRAGKADLLALYGEISLRPRLLEGLATTNFSAYVHYATREQAAALSAEERRRRWLTDLLAQRIRKRGEQLSVVYGDEPGIDEIIAGATRAASADRAGAREAPVAAAVHGAAGRPLVELARLVAVAVANHLASPADADATTLFAYLRTRVRFAMNVVTKERHRRDDNPLP